MSTTSNLTNSVRARYLDMYQQGAMARRTYDMLCYPMTQDMEKLQRMTSLSVPFLSSMTVGETEISETADVTPQILRDATTSISPTSRGEAIQDSELLLLQTYTDYGARRFDKLGENMIESTEALLLTKVMAGQVVTRAAVRASLDAGTTGHNLSDTTFADAGRYLYGLKCPMAPGVNSEQSRGALFAIMHPDAYYDLLTSGNIVSIAQYQQGSIVLNRELGSLGEFRIISSPWAKVFGGAGVDNGTAVATTLSSAANALSKTIVVASASNITIGSYLTIGTEETSTLTDAGTLYPMNERVKAISASGTTVTIVGEGDNGGLKYDHASGSAVRNADSVYPVIFGSPNSVAKAYAGEVGEYGAVVGPKMDGLLDQFVSLGWKWYGAFGIINENWIVRAEVSSSLDA